MNFINAFIIGGLLCIPAQLLLDKTKLTNARILTGYVILGVLLGGLGVYKNVIDMASAGATIPLTGYGNTLAKGVRDAVDENGLFGALYGGLAATAPGISTALIMALFCSLFFKSKQK